MGPGPLRASRPQRHSTRASGRSVTEVAGLPPLADGELSHAALTPELVATLQRTAGNRALSSELAWAGPVVQRHNSYEHQLLGDTRPKDVADAKLLEPDGSDAWQHLVENEYSRVTFFTEGADRDPRGAFPQTRWIQLGTSHLWVSSGELSAMGDYLPNPETIDTLPAGKLVPILQRMRQEIARSLYDRLTGGTKDLRTADADAYTTERNRKTRMKGAVGNGKNHLLPPDAQTIQDLDAASAFLGPNRQKGLMARNACHFAPFSWERWSLYHNEARQFAAAAFQARNASLAMRGKPVGMSEAERKAWVNNGYSNHFLQDSFAAGHLINKTLVMQWFAEYINAHQSFGDREHFGLPGRDVMTGMATDRQPGIADRRAYNNTRLHTTATQDRSDRSTATDPQTALERGDQEGRVAGSGVRSSDPEAGKEYGQYATFLNTAYLNLSANDIHDLFNQNGLKVKNKAGDEFVVGGDGTLLREDESAIGITLKADTLADQAIQDLISGGTTSVRVEDIFDLFPSSVFYDENPYPLEQWNDELVKKICWSDIFPKMAGKWAYKGVRAIGSDLIKGGGVLTPGS